MLNRNDVNHIVSAGNDLYGEILRNQPNSIPHFRSHSELPTQMEWCENIFTCTPYTDMFSGLVGSAGNADANTQSLQDSLEMASNVSNSLLCTFGSATIAISFDQHYQSWNIFDSHSRNVNGFSGLPNYRLPPSSTVFYRAQPTITVHYRLLPSTTDY